VGLIFERALFGTGTLYQESCGTRIYLIFAALSYTGCLMKNASTHNFFIYYPISMNKKIRDMVFQALQNSHNFFFFWALSSIANDSQLFFLNGRSFLGLVR
jgi:hypothetical protein